MARTTSAGVICLRIRKRPGGPAWIGLWRCMGLLRALSVESPVLIRAGESQRSSAMVSCSGRAGSPSLAGSAGIARLVCTLKRAVFGGLGAACSGIARALLVEVGAGSWMNTSSMDSPKTGLGMDVRVTSHTNKRWAMATKLQAMTRSISISEFARPLHVVVSIDRVTMLTCGGLAETGFS